MESPDHISCVELHGPLIELLEGHKIAAQADGDWVTFPAYPGRIQGLLLDLQDVHPLCSTQVTIRFSPWPGCIVCESFAGIGPSRDERIAWALAVFAQNTLHVLLRVFFGTDCGGQTNEWTLTNRGVPRTVTDGHVLCRGSEEAGIKLDWVKGFQRMLAAQPLSEGTHWVRLYFAQLDRQINALELLLDNEPWSDALATARSLPWPLSSGFLTCRMFLVIQGGVDVSRAIGLIVEHPQADDEQLEKLLIATGLSVIDARRVLLLAPIAFGDVLLRGLGIVDTTVPILDDGVRRTSINLETSPIYRAACAVAANVRSQGTMSSAEFFALAGRDARVKAVNSALHAGSEPQNLKLSPMVILWKEALPLCETPKVESASGRRRWTWFWQRSAKRI